MKHLLSLILLALALAGMPQAGAQTFWPIKLAPPGFNPADYGTVWAWYKKGAGNTVSQWDDSSGNGRHIVQPTAGLQPTVAGGGLTFDGTDNVLISNNPAAHVVTASVAIRFRQDGWAGNQLIFGFSAAGDADICSFYQNTSTPNVSIYNGTASLDANNERAEDNFDVAFVVYAGASSVLRFIDGTDVTGNPGTIDCRGFTLGAYSTGLSGSAVTVEEVIIWSTVVDGAGRTAVMTYLDGL